MSPVAVESIVKAPPATLLNEISVPAVMITGSVSPALPVKVAVTAAASPVIGKV